MNNDFGATGEYPAGKLNQYDEGEIRYGIAADKENKIVVLNFGEPIYSLGLPPQNAMNLAIALMNKVSELGYPVSFEVPFNNNNDQPTKSTQ